MSGMQYDHYSLNWRNSANEKVCDMCGKEYEPIKEKNKHDSSIIEYRCYCEDCGISWRI